MYLNDFESTPTWFISRLDDFEFNYTFLKSNYSKKYDKKSKNKAYTKGKRAKSLKTRSNRLKKGK